MAISSNIIGVTVGMCVSILTMGAVIGIAVGFIELLRSRSTTDSKNTTSLIVSNVGL